jgi:hypothetical protein
LRIGKSPQNARRKTIIWTVDDRAQFVRLHATQNSNAQVTNPKRLGCFHSVDDVTTTTVGLDDEGSIRPAAAVPVEAAQPPG